MKLLWIVNTIFPYPAEKLNIKKTVYGGWLNSLANGIIREKNIELTIASIYNGKNLLEMNDNDINYFLVPGAPAKKYSKQMEEYWKIIDRKVQPDVVQINGTEFTHGLAYLNSKDNVNNVVISIQGLVSEYAKVYLANIPYLDILKNITFRDIVRMDSMISARNKFYKRGKYEIEAIKKVKYITGRTIWDYSNILAINSNITFYKSNRILREPFYNSKKWNIDNIERHTIFCSQALYPIKGIHYVFEALGIVKKIYPDVKLNIAGINVINKGLKITGYGKYLKKIIKKYDIKENINFVGEINANEMTEYLLKSNVFVQSSSIENSPNSLGEAMMIGVPCIASFVGGTMDMLEHEKDGLLYAYTEPHILAQYIIMLFNDDVLCSKYSRNSINKASVTHDKNRIINENIEMYYDIYKKEVENGRN